MTDLSLNSGFDVHLDHRNDLNTVDERDEFEQDVAIRLTDAFYDDSGGHDIGLLRQKIKYQVGLVAQKHNLLDSVDTVRVQRSSENVNTLEVNIVYSSSASFDTSITL